MCAELCRLGSAHNLLELQEAPQGLWRSARGRECRCNENTLLAPTLNTANAHVRALRNLASHRGLRCIPVLATSRLSGSPAEPDPDVVIPFKRHFDPPTARRSLNSVLRRLKCRKSCNLLPQAISIFANMQVREFSEVRVFGTIFSFATFPTFSPKKCNISDTLRRWQWLPGNTAQQYSSAVRPAARPSKTAQQHGQAKQPSSTARQYNLAA